MNFNVSSSSSSSSSASSFSFFSSSSSSSYFFSNSSSSSCSSSFSSSLSRSFSVSFHPVSSFSSIVFYTLLFLVVYTSVFSHPPLLFILLGRRNGVGHSELCKKNNNKDHSSYWTVFRLQCNSKRNTCISLSDVLLDLNNCFNFAL